MPVVYDISTDRDREATQADFDKLQRTASAFGELIKKIKFYNAEVRGGLLHPGLAVHDIVVATQQAEGMAKDMDLDAQMQLGAVHGRHVLVVER